MQTCTLSNPFRSTAPFDGPNVICHWDRHLPFLYQQTWHHYTLFNFLVPPLHTKTFLSVLYQVKLCHCAQFALITHSTCHIGHRVRDLSVVGVQGNNRTSTIRTQRVSTESGRLSSTCGQVCWPTATRLEVLDIICKVLLSSGWAAS